MIEYIIIAYLATDSTLDSLLGVTSTDTKIYPLQAKESATVPYIVYNIPNLGTYEEVMREMTINFNCISDSYAEAKSIRDRIITLLDREDKIRNYLTDDDYYIYWMKNVGGANFKVPDLNLHHFVATFDVKFNKSS